MSDLENENQGQEGEKETSSKLVTSSEFLLPGNKPYAKVDHHIRTCSHTHTHTCIHTHTHTSVPHIYTHTFTHPPTHTHTFTPHPTYTQRGYEIWLKKTRKPSLEAGTRRNAICYNT